MARMNRSAKRIALPVRPLGPPHASTLAHGYGSRRLTVMPSWSASRNSYYLRKIGFPNSRVTVFTSALFSVSYPSILHGLIHFPHLQSAPRRPWASTLPTPHFFTSSAAPSDHIIQTASSPWHFMRQRNTSVPLLEVDHNELAPYYSSLWIIRHGCIQNRRKLCPRRLRSETGC